MVLPTQFPPPSARTSPYSRIHTDHLTHSNQDFAHSRGLQDPLPSALGLCPIKSPSPSCSNTSQHTAQCSVETRTLNCPWAHEGRARESCPRLGQYHSAHHIGFKCLTVKEILQIESAAENFKPLGFFRSVEINLNKNE